MWWLILVIYKWPHYVQSSAHDPDPVLLQSAARSLLAVGPACPTTAGIWARGRNQFRSQTDDDYSLLLTWWQWWDFLWKQRTERVHSSGVHKTIRTSCFLWKKKESFVCSSGIFFGYGGVVVHPPGLRPFNESKEAMGTCKSGHGLLHLCHLYGAERYSARW